MAKVLQIEEDRVQCELKSGKVVEYQKNLFGWDVHQGDEFSLKKSEDGEVYIEPSRTAIQNSISLADLDEDGDGTVSEIEVSNAVASAARSMNKITCPHCGSDQITMETMQETLGSTTISKTKTKSRRQGKGIIWWIFIGWWWWFVDLCFWFFAFFPRLVLHLFAKAFKKDKRVADSTTVETTRNQIRYIRLYTCQNCGNSWKKDMGSL